MIKSIRNIWPIFYCDTPESAGLDNDVLVILNTTLTMSMKDTDHILWDLKNWRTYEPLKKSWRDSMTCVNREGAAKAVVSLALAMKGVMSCPSNEGMAVIYLLASLGKADVLREYIRYNMDQTTVPPGIILGLGAAACRASSLDTCTRTVVENSLNEVCRRRFSGGYNAMYLSKNALARGLVGMWRKTLMRTDRLYSVERDETDLVESRRSSSWRLRFMWMCADPYKRLKSFNRPELVKTVKALKHRFPFALPDGMDLDTRTADDILDGLIQAMDMQFLESVVMDRYKVEAILAAYRRMCSLTHATKGEINYGLSTLIIRMCLFDKDPAGLVRKALSRAGKSWCADSIYLFVPMSVDDNRWRRRLVDVILELKSEDRAIDILFTPVVMMDD